MQNANVTQRHGPSLTTPGLKPLPVTVWKLFPRSTTHCQTTSSSISPMMTKLSAVAD